MGSERHDIRCMILEFGSAVLGTFIILAYLKINCLQRYSNKSRYTANKTTYLRIIKE